MRSDAKHHLGSHFEPWFDQDYTTIKKHPLFEPKKTPHIHDPSQKGFLDLPGEIRNCIYHLSFVREQRLDGRRTRLPGIALLQLNKRVHEEASSVLYAENTFTYGLKMSYSALERMSLHCFPLGLETWPTPTYHRWLRKLHIGISFSIGDITSFTAQPLLLRDLKAMREAYSDCWDDLDLTYEICEGNIDRLTFTMAWLKLRCFEAIAHPDCKVVTKESITPLVRWCLENSLRGRDPSRTLHPEQASALREAHSIAEASYQSGMHKVITDLSWRLVWGSPFGLPVTGGQVGWFGNPGNILFGPTTRRVHAQRDIYRRIEVTWTDAAAASLLLEDNEMRVFAALEMPNEKELLIERCGELRTYFALQEMAAKVIALEDSLTA